jgi:hypothetical protein
MWHVQTMNPEALERLYDDRAGLDAVALVEVALDSRQGLLRLRFELPRFPDRPAPRWDASANAAQVTLDCWLSADAASVDIRQHGWAEEHAGRLSLARAEGGIDLGFTSPTLELSARCGLARIANVVAYAREDAAPADPEGRRSDGTAV